MEAAVNGTDTQLLEQMKDRDAKVFSLSDAIDVKASIALVLITFLASQSADFFGNPQVVGWLRHLQGLSAIAAAAAGCLATVALWPREHSTETSEGFHGWVMELRNFYADSKNSEAEVAAAYVDGRIERLKESIDTNLAIHGKKATLVAWAFRATAVSLGANLVTLLSLGF